MPDVSLVCEGEPGGTDERVLQHALVIKLGLAVQLEPSGGQRAVGNVRSFLEKSLGRRSQQGRSHLVFTIEDRDYRPLKPERALMHAPSGQRSFVWARHEIENYLLAPAVVQDTFRNFQKTLRDPWVAALPTTRREVTQILENIGRSLMIDHIGTTVERQLDSALLRVGAPEYIVAPRPKGPSSPDHRSEWIKALTCAVGKVEQIHRAREEWRTNLPTIEGMFEAIEREVDAPAYFTAERHLVDFGGHELVDALWVYLAKIGAKRLSLEKLENELVAAFERVYVPGLFEPDEFQLLAQRLEQATNAKH